MTNNINPNRSVNGSGGGLPPALTWADLDGYIGPIEWDWEPWLPKGYFIIFAGMSGEGKSIVLLGSICASYLTGAQWPDGTPYEGETGKVLWVETEAAQALNLQRAKDFGLPLDQILIPLREDPLEDVSLENDEHREIIREMAERDDVRLIVVDSLSGSHQLDENSTDMLQVTKWLADLAKRTGKPVIATHHLNKKDVQASGGITLNHLRGSSSIPQMARTIWSIHLPETTNRSIVQLSVIKSNLAPFPKPLGLAISDTGIAPTVLPPVFENKTEQERVTEFLPQLLEDGPLPSTEVQKAVEEAGYSWDAAKRVKAQLGIRSEKRDDGWWWVMDQER